jgi:hypothetical protein
VDKRLDACMCRRDIGEAGEDHEVNIGEGWKLEVPAAAGRRNTVSN